MTAIHRWVEAARAGTNAQVVARMRSGWAILGAKQVLPGYCLLLPDPVVAHLNELKGQDRTQFLADMATLGEAVLSVTRASRINYEMLGNLEPALHAHVVPRYELESAELKTKPIWFYDWASAKDFSSVEDAPLMTQLRAVLRDLGAVLEG